MEVPQGHEAAQNKPWPRGGGGAPSSAAPRPPPKVYRVEPREFRDLVQRLTGAPPTALRRPQQHQHQHHHRVVGVAAPVVQPRPVRPGGEQQAYVAAAAPWFSFPMAGGVEAAAAAQPQHGAFL